LFNHTALKLITPPAFEPVSVALAKSHMRISGTLDDAIIAQYISAAREDCEDYTFRAIMPQTYRYSLDSFPLLPNSQYAPGNPNIVQPAVNNIWPLDPSQWAIFLPRSPVLGVTSIVYDDTPTTTQTMPAGNYIVDGDSEPARITTSTSSFWPSAVFNPNAVEVTFQAGYPAPTVTVTGSTAADTYTQSSSYSDSPVYAGNTSGNNLWFNGSNWIISPTVGAIGSAFWESASVAGTFQAAGTATGSPVAVLSSTIPARFIQAILLLVSHYYEHREAVWAGPGSTPMELPLGVTRLLNPLVIPWAW
jgi:hypothetical protein